MESPAPIPVSDMVRRFIVENRPVRGHFVRLEEAWRALREHQNYPAAVRELLGQAVSASVLLAATLKFRGTLTLQLHGNGAARLLVAQCTHDFRVRALVRINDERLAREAPDVATAAALTPEIFRSLVGESGRLVVTIEAAERDARYQGIVPLAGASFAECLEAYFASSEQLPTRVRLAADEKHAAGLLIQKLPSERGTPRSPSAPRSPQAPLGRAASDALGSADRPHAADAQEAPDAQEALDAQEAADAPDALRAQTAWLDAQHGIGRMERSELLAAPVEGVLRRNFSRSDVRLFAGAPVRFECRCDPRRVASILRALGAEEVREVLKEQGSVTVTCDFCNRPYRFDAVDVEQLFASGGLASGEFSADGPSNTRGPRDSLH